MNFRPRRMEEPEINVVSLIDVVLMLVVFFMLSSSFVGEGRLRIRLPQAGSVPLERPGSEKLIVSVTASGAYLVNDRELVNSGPDTLRAAILKVAGENRGAPVSVR
ncbi:MAG TPA: biopolymer transporter ExbD, partial [Steroidobacteraceae bacterium]|nr:biopolymer transporter ExbD [Steroidobacteraceae bacterium]